MLAFVAYSIGGSSRIRFFPCTLSVETSSACNLQCRACALALGDIQRQQQFFDLAVYRNIISEAKPYLLNVNLYFQGEPLLNEQIIDFVEIAKQHGIRTTISTNGSLLEYYAESLVSSGCSHIIVSIDGMNNETYSAYRKHGDLNQVCIGIDKLLSYKKGMKSKLPFLESQFLVTKYNEHEIDSYLQWAKQKGFDRITLKSAQIYSPDESDLIPLQSKYARYYLNGNGELTIKSKLNNSCFRVLSSMVITSDGEVVPCCFDKDAVHSYGNVHKSNIRDIVNNSKVRKFRNLVFTQRRSITICQNCSTGLQIKY